MEEVAEEVREEAARRRLVARVEVVTAPLSRQDPPLFRHRYLGDKLPLAAADLVPAVAMAVVP